LLDSLLQEITELVIMASSNSHQMDVDRQEDEEEWYNVNNEQITSMALGLQNRLSKLKLEILQAKARNKASKTNNGSLQLEDDGELFGEGADIVTDQLHKITKERTQTFLNFTSLSAAKKAAQASKAIIEAFNLEKGGKINLEKEEEDYLKSLLEEQKELIKDVLGQHKKGAEHDLEIIMSRIQLSKLFSRYSELTEKVVEARQATSEENMEGETTRLQRQHQTEDGTINQMRFLIQKLMISYNNFGLHFDDKNLNEKYRALLLRCGKSPEELRSIYFSVAPEAADLAPAAAADLEN